MKKLMLLAALLLTSCVEYIQATPQECESPSTLSMAVLNRELDYNQVLICPDNFTTIKWDCIYNEEVDETVCEMK